MLAFVVAIRSVSTEVRDADIAQRIASAAPDAPAAEAALYARFAGRIRLYGLRHLGSEHAAADLVQQVLCKVLEALRAGRMENPESLGSFVLGTCRHVTWDMRRAEARQRAIEGAAGILHEDVSPAATSEADALRLWGCILQLPERERGVVRMTFMEDRSADDIARSLGLKAGNVRVIRHRALARLHDCLEGGGCP